MSTTAANSVPPPGTACDMVWVPPPTPNGALHVGHLSGPYLAADVFRRRASLEGRSTHWVLHTDENQSYVELKSRTAGCNPSQLAGDNAAAIERGLSCMDIGLDGFERPTSDDYATSINEFFSCMFRRGALHAKNISILRDEVSGEFLVDAFVDGFCSTCLARTALGVCEACGHPTSADDVVRPRTKQSGHPVARTNARVLVFSLEPYRERLTKYLRSMSGLRPSLRRLLLEVLSRPLPDMPATYPVDWGCRSTIDGFDGQSYNPWLELVAAHVYLSDTHGGRMPRVGSTGPVVFMGFDNSFYYAVAHPALLMAHGEFALPSQFVTNDFYELEGEKFSTSNGHAIWATAAAEQYGSDNLRYFLARSGPGYQRANFESNRVDEIVERELTQPVSRLRELAGSVKGTPLKARAPIVLSQEEQRFAAHTANLYDVEVFDLAGVARAISQLVCASVAEGDATMGGVDHEELSAFLRRRLLLFAWVAYPIVPRLCDEITRELMGTDVAAVELVGTAGEVIR